VSANLDDRFRNRPQSAPDSTASNPTRRGATRRPPFGHYSTVASRPQPHGVEVGDVLLLVEADTSSAVIGPIAQIRDILSDTFGFDGSGTWILYARRDGSVLARAIFKSRQKADKARDWIVAQPGSPGWSDNRWLQGMAEAQRVVEGIQRGK
jgi:hypothetical protein